MEHRVSLLTKAEHAWKGIRRERNGTNPHSERNNLLEPTGLTVGGGEDRAVVVTGMALLSSWSPPASIRHSKMKSDK